MVARERTIRLRSLLDEYFAPLVVVLVLLAVGGGYLTYTAYAEAHTETETVRTASWESTASFSHSATVLNGTDVYARGEVLEERTSYFRSITPRLDGTFRYTYTATRGGDVTANASVVLVLRSVSDPETDEGNATEYWRLESPLATRDVESLSPGESLRVPFSLNMSRAAQRLQDVDDQLGGTPGEKELIVETRLDLSGTRNGRSVTGTRTYQLPMSLSGNVYSVQDPGPVTESGSQTEQRQVVVDPGPVSAYGGPLVLLVGLAGVGGLAGARLRGALSVSEREREWLAFRTAREEFEDWITVVRLPEADRPASVIETESLEGLVDLAVDTDRRVLHDETQDRFVVFDEDRAYTYDPPRLSDDASLSLRDGSTGRSDDSLFGVFAASDGPMDADDAERAEDGTTRSADEDESASDDGPASDATD